MSRVRRYKLRPRLIFLSLCAVIAASSIVHFWSVPAYGAQLGNRQLLLNNNTVGATAQYLISFDTSTAGTIGSIDITFCSNSPFPTDVCVAPVGMDASGTGLLNETGLTGFSIDPASNANRILLTRSAAIAPITAASYTFGTIINPSNNGSYYVRLQTFATSDATGLASDYGGIAFAIASDIGVSATVPPYLTFCAATVVNGLDCSDPQGQYVNVGELSPTATATGTSQFFVGTNAELGYNVTLFGPTMTSGLNPLSPLNINDISRQGTSQFGINLVSNSAPTVGADPTGSGSGMPSTGYDTPNTYRFNSGEIIAGNSGTELPRKYTVSYIVNVPSNQAPGVYVTTLTFICLADF